MIRIEEVYVIAYYGATYTKYYSIGGGEFKQYIGEGVVHESKPLSSYPIPTDKIIEHYAPKDKSFKYVKIEKRWNYTNLIRGK